MEGLLEEYQTLREEIQSNTDWTGRAFIFTISITATIVGYGLTNHSWAIFFSPFLIIIPSMFFVASKLESTTRIGSYMRIMIEPKIQGLNWQSAWLELRKENLLPNKRKYSLSISLLFLGISTLCIILAWIEFLSKKHILIDFITISMLSLFIIGLLVKARNSIILSFGMKLRNKYDEAWKQLDKQKHFTPDNKPIEK